MKCADCKQEFDNLAQLKEHKKVCPGEPPTVAPKGAFTIPLTLCPPETKYYALGQMVAMRVSGSLTKDGVVVQEVTLIR